MRKLYFPLVAIGAVAVLSSGAAAQSINLTGTYGCVQDCRDGYVGAPAFVTQNGDQFNLVTETGDSFRAWPDVTAPNSRIWIDARNESAVYSPDGTRIQFDDGRVWQRDFGPPPPPPGWRKAPVVWQR
jgi:antibiotic biosynthesis monooxygenase (ABM) superfamily enzyme